MYWRYKRLLLTILAALITIFIGGCTQPDDVLAPASSTKFVLSPERLPSLPQGMTYELWLKGNDGRTLSLGKFGWDQRLYRFIDSAGNEIDSLWTVDFDALKYDSILISVKKIPDLIPDSVGPVLLGDALAGSQTGELEMKFPTDLWQFLAGFSMNTPTDGGSFSHLGSGIWFAIYSYEDWTKDDTMNVSFRLIKPGTPYPLTIDTTWDLTQDPPVVVRIDTTNLPALRDSMITFGITNVKRDTNLTYIKYLDTFTQYTCTYDFVKYPANLTQDTIIEIDTVSLIFNDTIGTRVDTFLIPPFIRFDNSITFSTRQTGYRLDHFLADSVGHTDLPDFRGTQWHLKGWVLSPYLTPATCFGKLTKPNWLAATMVNMLNPIDGGMITTGSFKSFNDPDNSNPYIENHRVPPFPGEDFLVNLPACVGGGRGIYFADSLNPGISAGRAIITLEPDNYNNDTTNFPLVVLTSRLTLPSYDQLNDTSTHTQDFPMTNWFRAVKGDGVGFPAIYVMMTRQ